ncbi:hypothetical protein BDY21DRAFT_138188 [Lineolata rhizophorae]|uniref:Uncharacterized protein n=1 Tax=Lineolata rhizophorae TaxID=578093 RepID=A0A6A6PAS9_9PEZI|nr:hypothetical protein BDY21DRAFT_138188 [Lineolata rhizophorae]
MEISVDSRDPIVPPMVFIYNDSTPASLRLKTYNRKDRNAVVEQFFGEIRRLGSADIRVQIHWVLGHIGMSRNYLVDKVARMAYRRAIESRAEAGARQVAQATSRAHLVWSYIESNTAAYNCFVCS